MIACAPKTETLIETSIASRLGPQKYAVWFKDSTRLSLAQQYLHIAAPNHFVSEFIERNFAAVVKEAGREVTGCDLMLSFSIDPLLNKKASKKQPDRQADFAAKAVLSGPRTLRLEAPAALPLKGKFEDFAVGNSNRLAYAAARNIAENPGSAYNSLFVHGGCGLGKTHLLQAICNYFLETAPHLRWRYVTGEDFTSDYVHAVRSGQMGPFNDRYRGLDALIIDDVHILANKKVTQEGFLYTFKAMDAAGKQIVLASDAHPKLISHFSESLTSRFLSGMVVKVDAPDYDVRLEVLRRRAARLKADIAEPVLEHIAENFNSNIRELEGALLKVFALRQITGQAVTLTTVDQTLKELTRQVSPAVRLSDIENTVSIYFGIRQADLHTSKKSRTIALARGIAMYLARKHTDMSFPEIGRFMGNKNHSTVILAARRIGQLIDSGATVNWTSPGGPRSKNIGVIVEDIESQTGVGSAQPILGAA